MKIKNQTLDVIALGSSLLCAIHCAAIPIVLSFSALGSLHFLSNPWIEWAFITLGGVLVLFSIYPSYIKAHKNKNPLAYALVGFLSIGLGRLHLNEIWEVGFTVMGALLVGYAHLKNWKLLKACPHKH
jgi:hypothetical protein